MRLVITCPYCRHRMLVNVTQPICTLPSSDHGEFAFCARCDEPVDFTDRVGRKMTRAPKQLAKARAATQAARALRMH